RRSVSSRQSNRCPSANGASPATNCSPRSKPLPALVRALPHQGKGFFRFPPPTLVRMALASDNNQNRLARSSFQMGVFSMRMICSLLGVALLLAGLTAARADEKSQQLLEQAIKAHGGDKLAKQPVSIWKGKGTIQLTGMKIPFTGEWTVGGPT